MNISADLIKKQADTLVQTGLKDAGYNYINVDDGFFGHRDSTERMITHSVRFPQGVKSVADHIHVLGLKAGIYLDAGSNTCGSIWDNDTHGVGFGLYGHEQQDAHLYFNEWGFDFIKIDYCGAGQELDLEEEQRYTEICRTDGTFLAHQPGYPSGMGIGEIHYPEESLSVGIRRRRTLQRHARIGRDLSFIEEETHFGMWCIMSSPLLIGYNLTTIPESSLRLLKNKELIALNQDRLGLQAYVVLRQGEGYVLVKDVERLQEPTRTMALYNPSDTVCRFRIPLETLQFAGTVKMRDVV